MSTPLRPLSTGELLDRTFNLYRNNFILFAGIATVAAISVAAGSVLLMVLGISVTARGPGVDLRALFTAFMDYLGIVGLFSLLGSSLATGATIHAVSRVHLGQAASISESYKKVFPYLGRIILIAILIGLRMVAMAVMVIVSIFLVGLILGGTGLGTLYAIFVLLSIITMYVLVARLYLQYSVSVQACVLENKRTNDSISRSTFLTRDYLWRIFLIFLLMTVIDLALSFALESPGKLLFAPVSMAGIIWQRLANFLAYTLSFPIGTIATSLLYYDLRVRKEAFDLQIMMESLGQTQEQAAAAPASPVG